MTPAYVVVLDMDGVILQSNFIKHQAMLALFDAYLAQNAAISTFILANGGVPRKAKITAILETILKLAPTPTLVAEYLARYDRNLADELHSAPLVAGVAAFIGSGEYPFYVSSSAPEDEVTSQLARTGLLPHFSAAFGRDTPKAQALLEVKRQHANLRPIFFGDSISDLHAAQAANVAFVGVISERDNFVGYEVIKIKDFTSIEAVQHCMAEASLVS